ncbi:hypothetical protein K491DRAFT_723625 [Lophiostoma macrostomum CBS 122681]|uniref:Uncharacterized protein n=1 Tax=Lophiostoma macrostomum CBS 122681 TaxID=1314788 RepID=A0A6A6SJR6_9PLEO|nr:hypothetical protein K491DRAFT_723625 [Lophiostoma macrostomum CBS 122681]
MTATISENSGFSSTNDLASANGTTTKHHQSPMEENPLAKSLEKLSIDDSNPHEKSETEPERHLELGEIGDSFISSDIFKTFQARFTVNEDITEDENVAVFRAEVEMSDLRIKLEGQRDRAIKAEVELNELRTQLSEKDELVIQLKTVNRELNKLNQLKDDTGSVETRERAQSAEILCSKLQSELHQKGEVIQELQKRVAKAEGLEEQIQAEKMRTEAAESALKKLRVRLCEQDEELLHARQRADAALSENAALHAQVQKDSDKISRLRDELDKANKARTGNQTAFETQTFDLTIELSSKYAHIQDMEGKLHEKTKCIESLQGHIENLKGEEEKRKQLETQLKNESLRTEVAKKVVLELQAQLKEKDGIIAGFESAYWGDHENRRKKPKVPNTISSVASSLDEHESPSSDTSEGMSASMEELRFASPANTA